MRVDEFYVRDETPKVVGTPIRLAIAAQVLSGMAAGEMWKTNFQYPGWNGTAPAVAVALMYADQLIAEHNRGEK